MQVTDSRVSFWGTDIQGRGRAGKRVEKKDSLRKWLPPKRGGVRFGLVGGVSAETQELGKQRSTYSQ